MENKVAINNLKEIENRIFTIRGMQVMLDSHLAELYCVETKQLNRAVKRNLERFPTEFRFQLTHNEWDFLRLQIGTSKIENPLRSQNAIIENNTQNLKYQIGTSSSEHGGRRYIPYVFTEQGVAMLSAVLRSETAVMVSIRIMQAFVQMRKFISVYASIFNRLDKIENKQSETDAKFERIFLALENRETIPDKGIFFEGQFFDAYSFIANLIRKAQKSIILIDNYTDDTVLTLFAKREKGVNLTLYTKTLNKQLALDVEKFNGQYEPMIVKILKEAHDRFLILDENELYHIGASLKDLGKKWFAFSKMDTEVLLLLNKLHELK